MVLVFGYLLRLVMGPHLLDANDWELNGDFEFGVCDVCIV